MLRVQELERDGGDVGLRIQVGVGTESPSLDARPLADGDRDSGKEGERIGGPVFGDTFDGPVAGRLQFPGHLVASPGRRPVRHLQGGDREIPFDLRGEGERNDPGRQHGNAEDEQCDGSGGRESRPIGSEPHPAMQGTLHEAVQQQIHATLNPGHEYACARPGCPLRSVKVVGEVVGQHQQRFDKRDHQHRDDNRRQCLPDLYDTSGDEEQRGERGDGGQHREDQRHLDAARTADRRDDARRSLHSFQVDVFGDDDRVVHYDADGQNEREQRDRVDRQVERHHDGQGTDARNPETDGHPEGEPEFQKQSQGDQHQQEPEKTVLDEDGGALLEGIGFIVPDGYAHAFRKGGGHIHHLLAVGP